jgi:hypothetical protein
MRKEISLLNVTTDEALWAAYRRADKRAVTAKLFHRSLVQFIRRNRFSQTDQDNEKKYEKK